ncbi:predicted protein [Sclerotinia sclerotiorum 1980 UF-70]|uniref:Conidiation-specific protein 8 n=2 Tax=Sclerotinia sclerotiorum (strain ATCC 18683 / 1980 / Ss-1) TaxID=665079 RepID=A7F5J9_SCLS1|nr:predicted protein [Sclerotinia sclerotiorum 1980 UF-70]APA06448.1 hypothetical protein sscle_02g012180 [Sclerotinia sclerotiorum 1980 UF-70]EDN98020.1 predicted protein [Sclerotinia sclerotiorum 1980 UF-70]
MNAQSTSAVKGGSTQATNTAGITPQNRRGSQEGTMFAGLRNQKRSSIDAATQARRASFADQTPKAGFVAQMWNSFTKGT